MRIALVGAEDEVVVLTSTVKPNFGHLKAEINLTDYSVDDKINIEDFPDQPTFSAAAWKTNPVTFSGVLDAIHEGLKAGDAHVAIYQMRVLGSTNANNNPKGKALERDTGILQGLRATSVKEFLDQAEAGENK
ncbi:hypothetical protein N7516_007998 [Penicillium verrucosum]|uniref:uncharacterized protein n=1 Tax=Penicillium verrucosum TaxID=60171 RepID=UPI0025457C2D|nr:uncharacterized protein N7516_007998 [Penicillium verrucosum]KAJ5926225.1 hypothetical protein N7516_007998 [Penicillium verrucosum]